MDVDINRALRHFDVEHREGKAAFRNQRAVGIVNRLGNGAVLNDTAVDDKSLPSAGTLEHGGLGDKARNLQVFVLQVKGQQRVRHLPAINGLHGIKEIAVARRHHRGLVVVDKLKGNIGTGQRQLDDEIVDFSEIGQFIDTPVKRYSSGMKVKLGFSVASHLKSEIVIMDEVLAVGDVNFQNKCINQMKKLAEEEGRTILYVSHNMATVKSLCDRCIVLSHGQMAFEGSVEESIAVYMENEKLDNTTFFDTSDVKRHPKCNQRHLLQSLEILNYDRPQFEYGEKFPFRFTWKSQNNEERLMFKMIINRIDTTPVGIAFGGEIKHETGLNFTEQVFDTSFLVPGYYTVDMILYDMDESGNVVFYDRTTALRFEIVHGKKSVKLRHWFKDWGNAVLPCITKAGEN